MKGKVLLIDFKDNKNEGFYEEFVKWLRSEGIETARFYWESPYFFFEPGHNRAELDILKAIEAAQKVDVVYVHFGSIMRNEAAEIIGRLKATGVKVIVPNVSTLLFEAADYVFCTNVVELNKNIKRFCQEKNRS